MNPKAISWNTQAIEGSQAFLVRFMLHGTPYAYVNLENPSVFNYLDEYGRWLSTKGYAWPIARGVKA